MNSDCTLTFNVIQSASSSFDNNRGFENGMEGVSFIGDGGRIQATGPLEPQEGSWLAAISTGDSLISESGSAIGETTSTMIIGPINSSINSLSFYYNFISAEFNEWINSGFDDTALITITGPKGSHAEIISSVVTVDVENTTFQGFAGLDNEPFNNGYTGQTGWIKKDIVSDVGTPAYITFTVTDVKDEIVSSILAIDNINY